MKQVELIAEHFGMCHQQSKAIEELSELIQAISKIQIEGITLERRESLIEEIADVDFMKDQLMFLHEITEKEVLEIKRQKVERTMDRYKIRSGEDV